MSEKPHYINVKVSTNAKKELVCFDGDLMICKVNTPPVDGKANARLVELIAKFLKIPKTKIVITKGLASKNKTIAVFAPINNQDFIDKTTT